MTDPIESRRPRGTVALEAAAQRIAAGGSDGPLRQRLPDGPVTPETLDRVAYIIDTRPAPSTTAADCRAALVDWATRERTARDEDDGSREYAVKAWGEDKLTEHELATVSRYSHLGADFFRRLGIPEETIQKASAQNRTSRPIRSAHARMRMPTASRTSERARTAATGRHRSTGKRPTASTEATHATTRSSHRPRHGSNRPRRLHCAQTAYAAQRTSAPDPPTHPAARPLGRAADPGLAPEHG